jgi:hypothetical protein
MSDAVGDGWLALLLTAKTVSDIHWDKKNRRDIKLHTNHRDIRARMLVCERQRRRGTENVVWALVRYSG